MVVLKGEGSRQERGYKWSSYRTGFGTHVAYYFSEPSTKLRSMLIKFEALIQKRIGIMQKKAPETFERPQEWDEC